MNNSSTPSPKNHSQQDTKPNHDLRRTESTVSAHVGEMAETHLTRGFSIWGVLSVSWNIVNIFGGMSYIFVVGFSAGGLPAIFYGL